MSIDTATLAGSATQQGESVRDALAAFDTRCPHEVAGGDHPATLTCAPCRAEWERVTGTVETVQAPSAPRRPVARRGSAMRRTSAREVVAPEAESVATSWTRVYTPGQSVLPRVAPEQTVLAVAQDASATVRLGAALAALLARPAFAAVVPVEGVRMRVFKKHITIVCSAGKFRASYTRLVDEAGVVQRLRGSELDRASTILRALAAKTAEKGGE